MARLPKGIFGPVIGKLGALTGSTWKGIPYVKHTPEKGATKPITRQHNWPTKQNLNILMNGWCLFNHFLL